MKHELWYSVVVRDRQGKIVSRERRRSKSFLKQWNQVVFMHVAGRNVLSPYTITDTGGVPRVVMSHSRCFDMSAAAGNDDYGIRVGTGNTAVAIDDYALETPIVEGVGGGQMEHLVCTIDTSVVAAPSCSFEVHRTIVNNSGGVITVREAAIYMEMWDNVAPVAFPYCCATRDVLAAPQAVPDGGSITVDWTIGVTV